MKRNEKYVYSISFIIKKNYLNRYYKSIENI